MAQQATRTRTETTAIPPPVAGKARPGKAKIPNNPTDYTRHRLTFTDPDAFWAYMADYPNKDGVTMYMYRIRPVIDLSLIGLRESNIQKGGYGDLKLFSRDAVAEKFGRGEYQVKVTDSNRPEGQKEVVRSCQYKILEGEKAAVYDPRTLVLSHADNIDEVNRQIMLGVLVRDSTGVPRIRTAGDASVPIPAAAVPPPASGDLLGRDVLGQLILGLVNRGSANPHDTVKDTIEIARMLQPQTPAIDVEGIIERVVARLKPNGGGREDPFTNYERMEQFISKVRGPAAAAGGIAEGVAAAAGADSWAPHLGGILAQARAFLPEVVTAFRELRTTNGNGQNGHAPQQTQPNGVQQPMTMEQRIEQIFRLGFQKMQEGVTGFDFAAWVCAFHPGGLEVYKTLEPTGAVGLIALAAMNPQARVVVNDPAFRPQLEVFLTDFFSFDPDGGAVAEESASASAMA